MSFLLIFLPQISGKSTKQTNVTQHKISILLFLVKNSLKGLVKSFKKDPRIHNFLNHTSFFRTKPLFENRSLISFYLALSLFVTLNPKVFQAELALEFLLVVLIFFLTLTFIIPHKHNQIQIHTCLIRYSILLFFSFSFLLSENDLHNTKHTHTNKRDREREKEG